MVKGFLIFIFYDSNSCTILHFKLLPTWNYFILITDDEYNCVSSSTLCTDHKILCVVVVDFIGTNMLYIIYIYIKYLYLKRYRRNFT